MGGNFRDVGGDMGGRRRGYWGGDIERNDWRRVLGGAGGYRGNIGGMPGGYWGVLGATPDPPRQEPPAGRSQPPGGPRVALAGCPPAGPALSQAVPGAPGTSRPHAGRLARRPPGAAPGRGTARCGLPGCGSRHGEPETGSETPGGAAGVAGPGHALRPPQPAALRAPRKHWGTCGRSPAVLGLGSVWQEQLHGGAQPRVLGGPIPRPALCPAPGRGGSSHPARAAPGTPCPPRRRLVQFVTSRPECTLCYKWPRARKAKPDFIYPPCSGPAAASCPCSCGAGSPAGLGEPCALSASLLLVASRGKRRFFPFPQEGNNLGKCLCPFVW